MRTAWMILDHVTLIFAMFFMIAGGVQRGPASFFLFGISVLLMVIVAKLIIPIRERRGDL